MERAHINIIMCQSHGLLRNLCGIVLKLKAPENYVALWKTSAHSPIYPFVLSCLSVGIHTLVQTIYLMTSALYFLFRGIDKNLHLSGIACTEHILIFVVWGIMNSKIQD